MSTTEETCKFTPELRAAFEKDMEQFRATHASIAGEDPNSWGKKAALEELNAELTRMKKKYPRSWFTRGGKQNNTTPKE